MIPAVFIGAASFQSLFAETDYTIKSDSNAGQDLLVPAPATKGDLWCNSRSSLYHKIRFQRDPGSSVPVFAALNGPGSRHNQQAEEISIKKDLV